MRFERVKKRRKTKARKEDCCERPAPSNKMQLQKGRKQLQNEGSNEEKEGGNEEREGSRPPGSKNETLNPSQKTKAQEMHYVSWCRSLTAYVSLRLQAFWPLSFFVLGKLVMQEGL